MSGGHNGTSGIEEMIVIVANSLPDAVRGKLKLWFVEPRPNVFVSGIKDNLADRVVELVQKHCPAESGILIFKEIAAPPFYEIIVKGSPGKNISVISGFQLICEPEK